MEQGYPMPSAGGPPTTIVPLEIRNPPNMVAEPLAQMPEVHAGVWETARVPSGDSLDSTPSFEVTQQPQAVQKSRGNDQISDKSGGTVRSSSETATTRRGLTRGGINHGARTWSPRRQGRAPSPINPLPGMRGGGGRFPGGSGSMNEGSGGITNVGPTAEGFQQRHSCYNVGTSGNVSDDSIILQLLREMFKLRGEVYASRRVQTNWDMPNFQGATDWGGNLGKYGKSRWRQPNWCWRIRGELCGERLKPSWLS